MRPRPSGCCAKRRRISFFATLIRQFQLVSGVLIHRAQRLLNFDEFRPGRRPAIGDLQAAPRGSRAYAAPYLCTSLAGAESPGLECAVLAQLDSVVGLTMTASS